MYIELSFILFFSFATLFIMRKAGRLIGLVDQPNKRKHHIGAVPLVGGISIYISFTHFLFTHPDLLSHYKLYIMSITVLIVVGALDDKFDISVKIRFIVQAVLSISMMTIADIELHTLGNMFGLGELKLGFLGYVITTLAVIGAINAFNMVDGIDGLLGGLSIVTFGGIGIMLSIDGQSNLAYICLVLIVIIIPYILFNLGAFGRERQVFMGDAGSMLIGFTVIWFLLLASQREGDSPIRPVTALWLIAVPLMDMAAIMIRRIQRGVSPFKPDREHLHHIFQRLGLNSTQTLIAICTIATLFSAVGIYAQIIGIPEYIMFYSFIGCFLIYAYFLANIWVITAKIRSMLN